MRGILPGLLSVLMLIAAVPAQGEATFKWSDDPCWGLNDLHIVAKVGAEAPTFPWRERNEKDEVCLRTLYEGDVCGVLFIPTKPDEATTALILELNAQYDDLLHEGIHLVIAHMPDKAKPGMIGPWIRTHKLTIPYLTDTEGTLGNWYRYKADSTMVALVDGVHVLQYLGPVPGDLVGNLRATLDPNSMPLPAS